ncbi:MAG TPA: hypothetical protein VII31_03410 [Caldimonas sp.]
MATNESNPTGARLTSWLDGAQRPARAGVYQRRPPAGPYACWDGARWRADAASAAAAALRQGQSEFDSALWRGLAEPADAPCATCRGHTVIDHGVDDEAGADLIEECPDC